MNVTVSGLDALRRKLQAMQAQVKAEVQASLEQSGAEMVATARALAPVDEGELRDSIVMSKPGELTPLYGGGGQRKVGDLAVRVTAGDARTRYAFHIEAGTSKMAARPYFWPAYRVLKKKIKGRTSRAIGKAVRKAVK